MTKREMVLEIINGVNYSNVERVIENRCKNKKEKIEDVYSYYLNSSKTKEDKVFCSNLLIVW